MSKKFILEQMERERREELVSAWIEVLEQIVDGVPRDEALQKFLLEKDTISFKTLKYETSERRIEFVEIEICKWVRLGREIPIDLLSAYYVIAHSNVEIKNNQVAIQLHKKLSIESEQKKREIALLQKEVPILQKRVEERDAFF